MSLLIESVGGYCPCQADGEMDGNPFYFRARHGGWTLTVVRPGEDPVCPEMDGVKPLHEGNGDDPSMGYMEIAEAIAIIGRAYSGWFRTVTA